MCGNFFGFIVKRKEICANYECFKKSSIAENFNMDRFKIIKSCGNIFNLKKLKANSILIRKPKLCRPKEFDYIVSLFT